MLLMLLVSSTPSVLFFSMLTKQQSSRGLTSAELMEVGVNYDGNSCKLNYFPSLMCHNFGKNLWRGPLDLSFRSGHDLKLNLRSSGFLRLLQTCFMTAASRKLFCRFYGWSKSCNFGRTEVEQIEGLCEFALSLLREGIFKFGQLKL